MRTFITFVVLCVCALWTPPVGADHFILVRPMAVEGHTSDKELYIEEILRMALAHAPGDHTMESRPVPTSQGRGLRALANGTATYHVYSSGYSADREEMLSMIYIPLTRGLLGYRLLVAPADQPDLLADAATVQDLQTRAIFGSGNTWPDTTILRAAGLTVRTGNHNQLWEMLARGRITVFPRGMSEVLLELEALKISQPRYRYKILESVMIAYPLDFFFFTAKDDQRRADIITQGLVAAYDSGAFMAYFNQDNHIAGALAEYKRHPRRIIRLENPLVSDRVRAIPDQYWHKFK